MRLVHVEGSRAASDVLYELLGERPRETWISHGVMPSRSEHDKFVASRPFRYWYVLEVDGTYVGALECTDLNEIGVAVLARYRKRGYGTQAVNKFIQTHNPLPPIPAKRNGRWLANIATMNIQSKLFFARLGFKSIQETWIL